MGIGSFWHCLKVVIVCGDQQALGAAVVHSLPGMDWPALTAGCGGSAWILTCFQAVCGGYRFWKASDSCIVGL